MRREAEPLLRALAATLEDVAAALEAHDVEDAQAAVRRARALDPARTACATRWTSGTRPPCGRRRAAARRTEIAPYAVAVTSIDHAVRNTRVLARRALSAIEQDDRVPPAALAAVRELAHAVEELALDLADEARTSELEEELLRAAAHATAALDVTGNLSANMITGQVRAIAADLLAAIGTEPREARDIVRGARERTGNSAVQSPAFTLVDIADRPTFNVLSPSQLDRLAEHGEERTASGRGAPVRRRRSDLPVHRDPRGRGRGARRRRATRSFATGRPASSAR